MADTNKRIVSNAIRLLGETRLPGASLLLDGEFGQGALRVAAGVTARALIGPAGWLLVAADSYAKSTTGKSFVEQAFGKLTNSSDDTGDSENETRTNE